MWGRRSGVCWKLKCHLPGDALGNLTFYKFFWGTFRSIWFAPVVGDEEAQERCTHIMLRNVNRSKTVGIAACCCCCCWRHVNRLRKLVSRETVGATKGTLFIVLFMWSSLIFVPKRCKNSKKKKNALEGHLCLEGKQLNPMAKERKVNGATPHPALSF